MRVAARDTSGNTDASPATVTFKAYDCVSLKNAVTKAKKKVKKLTTALRAAKADDLDAKVERAGEEAQEGEEGAAQGEARLRALPLRRPQASPAMRKLSPSSSSLSSTVSSKPPPSSRE